jgi:hypothetical protein
MKSHLLSARSTALAAILFFGFNVTSHSQQNSSSEKPKTSTSVLDRVKDKDEDGGFIVIPVGQEIKVDPFFPVGSSPTSRVEHGKVVVPVRVGFTTAIPASTKVHLQFTYTSEEGSLYRITAVKINKKLYKVDTDEAPYAASEMRFTLTKPLRIAR